MIDIIMEEGENRLTKSKLRMVNGLVYNANDIKEEG